MAHAKCGECLISIKRLGGFLFSLLIISLFQPSVNEAIEKKDCLFGTVDSWILWNLSNRKVHFTDDFPANFRLFNFPYRFTWLIRLTLAEQCWWIWKHWIGTVPFAMNWIFPLTSFPLFSTGFHKFHCFLFPLTWDKSVGDFFCLDENVLEGKLQGVPLCGVLGDQQAALLGQGCIHSGGMKVSIWSLTFQDWSLIIWFHLAEYLWDW